MEQNEFTVEGRNAVLEAFRAGRPIDRLYILDGCKDGPILSIKREAAKQGTQIKYVAKERLDQLSETGHHQGVIASAAAYGYTELDEILEKARAKEEPPFYCFWTALRILTILVPSSARRIWRARMVS